MLVEAPVHDRVGAGEPSFHRFLGEALGELPRVNGYRTGPGDVTCYDRLVIVTIAVRADEAAFCKSRKTLGKVCDHVAAIHLAIHENVHAQLFLRLNPKCGGFALQVAKLIYCDFALCEIGAGAGEVVGFWEAAHGSCGEKRQLQTEVFEFFAAHAEKSPLGHHGRANFSEQLELGKGTIAGKILETAGRIEIGAPTLNFWKEAIDLAGNFAGVFEFCVASINETEAERLGRTGRSDEVNEFRVVSEIKADDINWNGDEFFVERRRIMKVNIQR